jgi:hypothetical protein
MHDIGYVRGLLDGDSEGTYVIDDAGHTVTLPRGASDAALTHYHVDRSKLFVRSRFRNSDRLDAERLARMIEFTRFPAPEGRNDRELDAETGLVRAADLIGSLAIRVTCAKPMGSTRSLPRLGSTNGLATNPQRTSWIDTRPSSGPAYPPRLRPAVRHLNVTADGRRWLAQLHANVFRAEHKQDLNERGI